MRPVLVIVFADGTSEVLKPGKAVRAVVRDGKFYRPEAK